MARHKQQCLVYFGYAGRRFHGVAPQQGVVTAGGALLARVTSATAALPHAWSLAARTDAGVAAVCNIATFRFREAIDTHAVTQALQAPRDDGLTDVVAHWPPRRVMARNMAAEKHYCYRIAGGRAGAVANAQTWVVAAPFDVARLRQALEHACGTHDFSAFCHKGQPSGRPVRSIRSITVEVLHGPASGMTDAAELAIHIYGDNFLRRMVRMLVFTALAAACGLRSVHSVRRLLAHAPARSDVSAPIGSAPARGLTLMGVALKPELQKAVAAPPTTCQAAQSVSP